MKCRCLLKHTETVEEEKKKTEEKRRAQLKERREREPETPLGTAFRCRGRPTAEYCRRLVVMETGRQSRLFMELCKNEPPHPPPASLLASFPSSLPLLRSSLPPGRTQSQDRKPDGKPQVGFLPPETKTGRGGAGRPEVSLSVTSSLLLSSG